MNRVANDSISRVAAIDAIEGLMQRYRQIGAECDRDGALFARECIKELPAVDTKPVVHGRWIKMTGMMPPEYHGHYECSECGWHMKGLRNSWTKEEELNYCPNCGAKMETKNE